MALALLLAALPALYWPQPTATAPALKQAGIQQVLVPAADLSAWQGTGIEARPLPPGELAAREVLRVPGPRPGPVDVASASRRPWLDANGWRILRRPGERYAYQLPAGRAALAAAEAFAYGADAVLTVDPLDLDALGRMLAFLSTVPPLELPPVVDVAVVDDGSFRTGEVLNLMARRNLLFEAVRRPARGTPLVVKIGSREYPEREAADPFALAVRRRLGDARRSLRLYGSEVVLARLTGDGGRRRLQLLNYGGNWTEGLRVRLIGAWTAGPALVAGRGEQRLENKVRREGATEFTLPWLETYAVVDLQAASE
jgi:hypothetical protein